MQELYNLWVKQCSWGDETALQLQPPHTDPEHLRGLLLNRVGRSTAMDMVDAEFDYLVVDIAEHVQVVAMGSDVSHPLEKHIGDAGARMLFQGGHRDRVELLHNYLMRTPTAIRCLAKILPFL